MNTNKKKKRLKNVISGAMIMLLVDLIVGIFFLGKKIRKNIETFFIINLNDLTLMVKLDIFPKKWLKN